MLVYFIENDKIKSQVTALKPSQVDYDGAFFSTTPKKAVENQLARINSVEALLIEKLTDLLSTLAESQTSRVNLLKELQSCK